jgi:transposase
MLPSQGLTSADSEEPTGAETPADALGESKRMSANDAESQESCECPTCGRDDFGTVRAMKLHHAQKHNKSIAGILLECEECGSEFRRSEHKVQRSERNFCSIECRGAIGPDTPESKVADERLKDESWLREQYFDERLNGDEIAEKLDCTAATVNRWFRKHGIDRPSHRKKGAKADKRLEDAEWLEREYITNECAAEEIGERVGHCEYTVLRYLERHNIEIREQGPPEIPSGKEHWNWRGGQTDYGEGWSSEKRRRVRKRDGCRCQACGMKQQEHIAQHGMRLDVHHIIPAREFEDATARNAMTNLITFCRSCHNKWEGIPLRPQTE